MAGGILQVPIDPPDKGIGRRCQVENQQSVVTQNTLGFGRF